MEESFFWPDQIADNVVGRRKFSFVDKKFPKVARWSVKSSSSLSGVLHVGRLSDIVRGEAVFLSLKDKNFPVDFIYVLEDMDPLRKVPKGVPAKFVEFIGHPVSDIPDPFGCHSSYAGHFKQEFLDVFEKFMLFSPRVFSMRQEYKRGNFAGSALLLLEHKDRLREIIRAVQGNYPPKEWFPWKPICDNCGNLQTTRVTGVERDKVSYVCKDYEFETTVARGCNHEGLSSLKKCSGKLVWKSEWASQWKRWSVCSEGAGKEYESSNSSFWVNARVCEEILAFPHPVPIFYEHLMVDNEKMSASKGNVVYPKDWLEVARPEALKFLYMKKLMRARSFKWDDIPILELELDRVLEGSDVQYKDHKRFIGVKGRKFVSITADYGMIAFLVQLFDNEGQILDILKKTGKLSGNESKESVAALRERIALARSWVKKRASDHYMIKFLDGVGNARNLVSGKQAKCLCELAFVLPKKDSDKEIHTAISETAQKNSVSPRELFQAIYLSLIGKSFGPKASSLILAFGKEKCIKRFKEFC